MLLVFHSLDYDKLRLEGDKDEVLYFIGFSNF